MISMMILNVIYIYIWWIKLYILYVIMIIYIGIQYVRGGEVFEFKDEEDNILNDNTK